MIGRRRRPNRTTTDPDSRSVSPTSAPGPTIPAPNRDPDRDPNRDPDPDHRAARAQDADPLRPPSPSPAAGDPLRRRAALVTRPAPRPHRDLLVILDEGVPLSQPALVRPRLRLAYIADRLLLDAGGFQRYVLGLGRWIWPGAEDLALAVLDDINNEAVPAWVRVEVIQPPPRDSAADLSAAPGQVVVVEDHQPLWRGPPPVLPAAPPMPPPAVPPAAPPAGPVRR